MSTMASAGAAHIMEVAGDDLLAVPQAFIRPLHDRPQQASTTHGQELPIIDVSGLHSPHTRPQVLRQIGEACSEWGFFQAVNHGVKDEVVEEMKAASLRFFNQPASEKNKLWCHRNDTPVSYTTSFNPSKEVTRDWKNALYVRDIPGVCCNGFDVTPEICREAFQQYRRGVEKLANILYEAIFESLGLSSACVKEGAVPGIGRLVVGVNYYPPCPDPSLTYGISGHSDIGSLTILLQDDVPGLQIRKADDWFQVKPLAGAFVINVADQIEILTNGKYKSIEHRVITNAKKPRLSVAFFYGPLDNEIIAPLPNFVSQSEPALYKGVKYEDYVKNFFSGALLPNKVTLNLAK